MLLKTCQTLSIHCLYVTHVQTTLSFFSHNPNSINKKVSKANRSQTLLCYLACYLVCSCYFDVSHIMWPWPWPRFIPHPYERIGPHFDVILVCRELPPQLLPRWVPFFVGLSWQHLSSSLSANQVLSWSLEPPNRVLAVEFVEDPVLSYDQASAVFYHW